MASRHQRSTNIGEFYPFHINAFTPTPPANPTVQAAGSAAGTGNTLTAGAYTITYAWVNANGQSTAAPTSITITVAAGNAITTTAVTPPGGVTSVNWYIVTGPGFTGLVGNNSGAAFVISANLSANGAQPQAVSTTATRIALPNTVAAASALGLDGPLDYGHGTYIDTCAVSTQGSSATLTLFNGNSGNPNTIVAQVLPTTNVTLQYQWVIPLGLYYTYLGTTAGSLTIGVLPVVI